MRTTLPQHHLQVVGGEKVGFGVSSVSLQALPCFCRVTFCTVILTASVPSLRSKATYQCAGELLKLYANVDKSARGRFSVSGHCRERQHDI